MLEFISKSSGRLVTDQALTGTMLTGVDVIGGTAKATVQIYDGGSNSSTNVLFEGSANIAETVTFEMSYPVAGTGNLWVEITGTQANAVVRYK